MLKIMKNLESKKTEEETVYRSTIKARDFASNGTAVLTWDFKNHRPVELMSQGERMMYDILSYRTEVIEIKEQYRLDMNLIIQLSDMYGIEPPRKGKGIMTTDLVAICNDGCWEAYSIKASRKSFEGKARKQELAFLEKKYWELQGVPFKIVFKDEMNKIFADNLRECRTFADVDTIFDEASCLKHMIWHRLIEADIDSEEIRIPNLMTKHRHEVRRFWRELQKERNIKCS